MNFILHLFRNSCLNELMIPNYIQTSFRKLEAFCRRENFQGFDAFDGLNSRVFQSLPIIKNASLARLAWIQFFKRSPINLRNLAAVKKDFNPKGIALFLSGYSNLYQSNKNSEHLETIKFLADKLIELRSAGFSGSCWGYNFDWQARAFFQPEYTPTVVATTYAACALLDAFEATNEKIYFETAIDARDFVLKDLNKTFDADGDFAFSYSPLDETQIFNASLLGTRLLSRIYSHTKDAELIEAAEKSARFCVKHQRDDGAWSYGTLPFHSFVDNFHTGYNLECLDAYRRAANDKSFDENIERGFAFYVRNFFTAEGIPKYYDRQIYPIDPHNTAQLVVTLVRLGKFDEYRELADRVLRWTIENMQSEAGFFYYQKTKHFINKIPYMRWTQAWMFYALTEYLRAANQQNPDSAV